MTVEGPSSCWKNVPSWRVAAQAAHEHRELTRAQLDRAIVPDETPAIDAAAELTLTVVEASVDGLPEAAQIGSTAQDQAADAKRDLDARARLNGNEHRHHHDR